MSDYRQIIQYDSNLGHRYVENINTLIKYGKDNYYVKTDSYGFRNNTENYSSKKTIIILGDSFAAGDSVSNSQRFSDIIQKELDCNVINLAVSGYGVDQQLSCLSEI